jgi:hypothetical protein
MEFEKVRNEMGRLAFVGESIIILCQTIAEEILRDPQFKDSKFAKNA